MSFTRTRTRMTFLQCLNSMSYTPGKSPQIAHGNFGHLISMFINTKYARAKNYGGEFPLRSTILSFAANANAELVDLLARNILQKVYGVTDNTDF